ncbi:MAG: hypothetical protein WBX20_00435 [Terrimicrobiaceae bacterium]
MVKVKPDAGPGFEVSAVLEIAVVAGKHVGYSRLMVNSPATSASRVRFCRLLLFPAGAALLLAACQTTHKEEDWDVPLTLRTVGPAYADYVLEIADANKDRTVTYVEWINAGGSKRSFELVDQNKDGVVTRTELIRFGSNARVLDMTRRYVDFNKDNKLTPREFRSPAGVRLLRIEF